MAICRICGRKKPAAFLSRDGICNACQKQIKESIEKINKQIQNLQMEHEAVLESADLTPETIFDFQRAYHYKDVNVWVVWQYSGRYGKTCSSLGMKRGDLVDLYPHQIEDDPKSVTILWHETEIAHMKNNRLRDMVLKWQAENLPVLAVVSAVGGEQKLMLEFAFYKRSSKMTEAGKNGKRT